MAEQYLPSLSHFENGNPWLASAGRLRYLITPTLPGDGGGDGSLSVEIWEGPWAKEFSDVEETAAFPLGEEGLAAILPWLEARRLEMDARPRRTLAQELERRDAHAKSEK